MNSVRIIKFCGCLPLALSLVGARARIRRELPLSVIAAELDESHGSLDAFAGADFRGYAPDQRVAGIGRDGCVAIRLPARRHERALGVIRILRSSRDGTARSGCQMIQEKAYRPALPWA